MTDSKQKNASERRRDSLGLDSESSLSLPLDEGAQSSKKKNEKQNTRRESVDDDEKVDTESLTYPSSDEASPSKGEAEASKKATDLSTADAFSNQVPKAAAKPPATSGVRFIPSAPVVTSRRPMAELIKDTGNGASSKIPTTFPSSSVEATVTSAAVVRGKRSTDPLAQDQNSLHSAKPKGKTGDKHVKPAGVSHGEKAQDMTKIRGAERPKNEPALQGQSNSSSVTSEVKVLAVAAATTAATTVSTISTVALSTSGMSSLSSFGFAKKDVVSPVTSDASGNVIAKGSPTSTQGAANTNNVPASPTKDFNKETKADPSSPVTSNSKPTSAPTPASPLPTASAKAPSTPSPVKSPVKSSVTFSNYPANAKFSSTSATGGIPASVAATVQPPLGSPLTSPLWGGKGNEVQMMKKKHYQCPTKASKSRVKQTKERVHSLPTQMAFRLCSEVLLKPHPITRSPRKAKVAEAELQTTQPPPSTAVTPRTYPPEPKYCLGKRIQKERNTLSASYKSSTPRLPFKYQDVPESYMKSLDPPGKPFSGGGGGDAVPAFNCIGERDTLFTLTNGALRGVTKATNRKQKQVQQVATGNGNSETKKKEPSPAKLHDWLDFARQEIMIPLSRRKFSRPSSAEAQRYTFLNDYQIRSKKCTPAPWAYEIP